MDVLDQFPVRKNKKQKEAFRTEVEMYAQKLGYPVNIEKGSMGANNVVIGEPNSAKYLITAHYDTPSSIGLPNVLTPCNPFGIILWSLLLVAVLLTITDLVRRAVFLLTDDFSFAMIVWYVLYFGALILMIAGPANKNNANDNTSGVVTLLETAAAWPIEKRHLVCFVLFDLEEAGLVGSNSYRKVHKEATNKQIVLNMDCVGDGDEILLVPMKKLKKDTEKMEILRKFNGIRGNKSISLREKGFAYHPSDNKNFPYGLGIAAFNRNKVIGLYVDRIHTARDTILDEENVDYLRDALLKLAETSAAE